MKKIIFLLFILKVSLFAQVDSLFSKRLSEPYEKNFVREVIGNIPEKLSKAELNKVKQFTIQNKKYGEYGIPLIVKNESNLVKWLNSVTLTRNQLIKLGNSIDSSSFQIHKELYQYLFSYINKQDSQFRNVIYGILGENCTFEYSIMLINIFDFETDYENRTSFLECQLRFKSEITDSLIFLEFKKGESLQDLYILTKLLLKKYNRYDFLPQLKELPIRVEQIRTPDNRYADKVLKELKTLIPYLEQKKKENAPIGLPLDWGMKKE